MRIQIYWISAKGKDTVARYHRRGGGKIEAKTPMKNPMNDNMYGDMHQVFFFLDLILSFDNE